jgi:hypothetical protein
MLPSRSRTRISKGSILSDNVLPARPDVNSIGGRHKANVVIPSAEKSRKTINRSARPALAAVNWPSGGMEK